MGKSQGTLQTIIMGERKKLMWFNKDSGKECGVAELQNLGRVSIMLLCDYPCSKHDSLSTYNIYENQTNYKCPSKEYTFKNCVLLSQSLSLFITREHVTVKFEKLISETICLILNNRLTQFKIK